MFPSTGRASAGLDGVVAGGAYDQFLKSVFR